MPGIEELVNYQDIWDYGARGNGNSNDAWAINAAIAAAVAKNANGGRILIRPTANFYNIDTPIVLYDDLEILLVGGAELRIAPGLDVDAIYGSGVSRCRIHGNGVIIGTYDFGKTYAGIHLVNSYLCSIEGVHIAGMARSGIFIDGGSDHRLRSVVCASNGGNGIRLSGTTRCHVDSPICYNNGQHAAGSDGIALDTAATHNTIVSPACFDAVGPYPVNQAYPIREVAASGCDYTTIFGLQATGNATSNSPSLIGANSKWIDNATVGVITKLGEVVCAGSQTTVSFSGLAATYRHLLLEGSYALNAPHKLSLQVNGDTGANYSYSNCFLTNGSVNSGSGQTSLALDLGAVGAASGTVKVDIPGYALTIINHDIQATWVAGVNIVATGGTWANTAAINALTLLLDAGNFVDGSVFTLYGVG